MEKTEYVQTLEQIIALAQRSLKNVSTEVGSSARIMRHQVTTKEKKAASLPDRIVELRDSEFFKQPKTAIEVHEKLQSSYPCSLDRVVTALGRLKTRKLIRKTTKKVEEKAIIAYAW